MNQWKRTLAALLTVLMFCSPWNALSEVVLDLEHVAQAGIDMSALDTTPGKNEIELNVDLVLNPLELPNLEPEVSLDRENQVFSGTDLLESKPLQPNDKTSDFEIQNGVLVKYRGDGGNVVIPKGITRIGNNAFYNCDSMTSVTIPNSVTIIEDFAFYRTGLTRVVIPNSVTDIGEYAFYRCESLTSVIISGSVSKINFKAFANCESLSDVTILSRLINIVIYAFDGSDPDFHIISGSDAIDWVEDEGYDYDILQDGLSERSLKLLPGETQTLTAYVMGKEATGVIWTSSNKMVATVKNGIVTAHETGNCVITAKLKSGRMMKCNVIVYDPAELSETSLSLKRGESIKLTVSGLLNRTVSWSSSDSTIATVKNGRVTAREAGKCVITAKLSKTRYLAEITLKCQLTVADTAKLSRTSLSMSVGDSVKLTISGIAGRKVTWSSSNKNVATVDRGKVTAVTGGTCNIIAKVGQTKLICSVTVAKPLKGDIQGILGKNIDEINKRLPDKLRYFDYDAYTNDYFLVQTDDRDNIISIALLTDAESDIGKYTLYGLYPSMDYKKASSLLINKGWKLDSESYDKSFFYNPKNSKVSFYVTIKDNQIDLVVYMIK